MRKFVEKCRKISKNFFQCPNNKFDEEFKQIFQYFYFFGFYQPTPSRSRILLGIFSLSFVLLSYILAVLENGIASWKEGNINKISVFFSIIVINVPFLTQLIFFAWNQNKFIVMVKTLQSLHEYRNKDTVQNLSKKLLKMMKFYLYGLFLVLMVLLVSKLAGYGTFKLLLPVLYDRFADGLGFFFLLPLNIFHYICAAYLLAICDLFSIFCMMRLEANLKFLSYDLRHCTDSLDQKENEKNLTACVKYHQAINE